MNKYYKYSIYHSIKNHTNYLLKTIYVKDVPLAFTRKAEGSKKQLLNYLKSIKKEVDLIYEL